MARLVKAKVLYKQGRKKDAENELSKAERSVNDFRWQKAEVHYAKANLDRKDNQPKLALASYKRAL